MGKVFSGAEIVFKCLEDQKVEHVFGYPGGAILPIYDELKNHKSIKHILVRHEQGAGHAAEGYARSSGKIGVAFVTSGPGATNIVTALTDAYMDSIPIVCISGQVPTHLIGTDAFQECDTTGITRPCTKHNWLVKDVNNLSKILHRAFEVATTGRPGPVLVDIPKDIQFKKGKYVNFKNNKKFNKVNRNLFSQKDIDVLIVDEMGKNISGTGMDTNIIGRRMQDFEPEPVSPQILRIVVRGLTSESEGNAVGVGLADFTTQRLVNQINHHYTYINSITGMGPQKARIPVYFDTDREVIEAAFSTIGMKAPESGRAVRIKNTLHLGEVAISETLMDEIADRDDLEVRASLSPLPFDHSGTLVALS
mgnify:CR=1 FL=1